MKRAVVFLFLVLVGACNVNEYCIDCPTADDDTGDDGGPTDGGVDANDGGGGPDACVPVGNEVCNGLDDDCNGTADDNPTDIGQTCGTDEGECTAGVWECNAGERECSGVPAAAESCDNLDNDCDGTVDDGNPGGGDVCGSDTGECVAGVTTCTAGQLQCLGASGTPGQDPELCDGRDNDCDGTFDEGVATQGPCGFPDTGECVPGEMTCVGGAFQCVGGTGPTFELCDNIDQDCDGDNDNGYDLQNDVRNCGTCNHSCVGTLSNSTEMCSGGNCAIATCDSDFYDNNNNDADGCEYGPCEFQGPVEGCNLADDDCDGTVDENLTTPGNFCDPDGACAGTTPSCTTDGWDCVYGGTVSTDGNGDIVPETDCDNIDNDCDGNVDESHPDLGDECAASGQGVCQARGHRQCNTVDPDAPTVCVEDTPGGTSSAEICDDLDNDCDGNTDEGATAGNLQDWVSIGGGRQIMKYEASHPDARVDTVGSKTAYVCSRAGVQPWTSVTHPQAEAACAAIGARLCTEQEWHRACAVVTGTTYPVVQGASGDAPIFIEAEDYFSRGQATSGGVVRAWVPDYTAGFSGISALRASPNTGVDGTGADVTLANAVAQSPRLSYQVTFNQTGNHRVWVRMYSPNPGDAQNDPDDTLHVGIATNTTTAPTVSTTTTADNQWIWMRFGSINVTSTGTKLVNLFMQEDGVKIDAIYITKNTGTTAPTNSTGDGGHWSFETNPDTYVGTTCNGEDNDSDGNGANGDQDLIVATGSKAACFANGTGSADVFDLSGNVKEWTLERTPGVNPIRGGASNNEAEGISCSLAFTAADDDFFFDNVGFRCCR